VDANFLEERASCIFRIKVNGVVQLGHMGKVPYILVTENYGREGAGRGACPGQGTLNRK
jgi:galactose-1-phosphate uridylyltransferase